MMIRLSIVTMIVLILSSGAVQAQKGQSVMFGDEDPSLTSGDGTSAEAGNRCEELREEVDALKGRPQRRATAMSLYEAECKDARAPTPLQPATP